MSLTQPYRVKTLDGHPAVGPIDYVRHMGIDECAYWGVKYDGQEQTACGTIWTQANRDFLSRYLMTAQTMIENVVGYFLAPTYVTATVGGIYDPRLTDHRAWCNTTFSTRYPHILSMGVRVQELFDNDIPVSYADGIGTIGPVDVDSLIAEGGTVSELVLSHSDEQEVIIPADISFTAGTPNTVTITVPQCRLVKLSVARTHGDQGVDITDMANFVTEVDLYRVYTDTTEHGYVVAPDTNQPCLESKSGICAFVENHRLGTIKVRLSEWDSGKWVDYATPSCGGDFNHIQLQYLSGIAALPPDLNTAVIRLAHAQMPEVPCACGTIQSEWTDERRTPEFLDERRANCPFGSANGQWHAFLTALSYKMYRGLTL